MHHRRQFTTNRFANDPNHLDDVSEYAQQSVPSYAGAESPEGSIGMYRYSTDTDPYQPGHQGNPQSDAYYEARDQYDYDYFESPGTYYTTPGSVSHSGPTSHDETTFDPAPAVRRSGAHRIPTPPSALKGRAAVLAVAAGAVVAAGQAATNGSTGSSQTEVALASDAATTTAEPQAAQFDTVADTAGATQSDAPQVLNIAQPADLSQFDTLLAKGQRFSEERAAREAAARRPLFVLPCIGNFTSSFGSRWGTLHAGVDVAAPIGTPIVAVADGTVIETGPAAGFGMWVRLLHADGTITVYGHINQSTVSEGQHVMAGDQIATVGNRGFSTGPHLHFEVHIGGGQKIDPVPWLASRGISLGFNLD